MGGEPSTADHKYDRRTVARLPVFGFGCENIQRQGGTELSSVNHILSARDGLLSVCGQGEEQNDEGVTKSRAQIANHEILLMDFETQFSIKTFAGLHFVKTIRHGMSRVLKKWDSHLATPLNQEEFWLMEEPVRVSQHAVRLSRSNRSPQLTPP